MVYRLSVAFAVPQSSAEYGLSPTALVLIRDLYVKLCEYVI
jgi:hypothetical protein